MPSSYKDLSPSLIVRHNGYGQPIGQALDGYVAPAPLAETPMTGQYVNVRLYDPNTDTDALYQAYAETDESLWTYMPFGPFASPQALRAQMCDYIDKSGWQTFVICDPVTGRPLGQSSYMRHDLANASVEIGSVSFSPLLKRSRMATEAMYLMMKRAFDGGFRRYEWKCDQLNEPSNKAALRLGFTYEGTFRNAVVIKGRRRDTCWYSVIIEDWPEVKARLEAWLDPANFDAAGQQLTPLRALFL